MGFTSAVTATRCPDAAQLASLGCGNPTAVADLHEGETVLDLGSGGGIDVLLSARRVGPTGKAYGLDMTDEMLDLARRNQREAGVENVEFVKGTIEDVPLPDDSVDVVISNCVINLSGDKPRVFREAARVLRPGGRFAVSDVVADPDMDEATRRDMQQWTGCIAGALTREDFERELIAAGFEAVEIRETHRVHDQRCVGDRPRTARGADAAAEIQLNDPQTLYRRWEDSAMEPVRDRPRSGSRAMGGDGATRTGALVHWVLASLMVAEERITTKFSGLVGAYGTEEEATFLATQQVDEARHMQFYARFQDEVVAEPATVAAHVERARREVTPAFEKIFDGALVEAHERLVAAPADLAAKVRFVTIYHLILESHARADHVPVRHRVPRARGAVCPGSSRATRRSTTTRPATSATASGSCARPSGSAPTRPTRCARRFATFFRRLLRRSVGAATARGRRSSGSASAPTTSAASRSTG